MASCAAPTLHVEARPPGSELFVDAAYRGREALDTPLPYYGTIDLAVIPTLEDFDDLRPTRTSVDVPEPVSPWLFPLDFLVEVAAVALGSVEDTTDAAVTAAPREDLVIAGRIPPSVEGLRVRAAAMEAQR